MGHKVLVVLSMPSTIVLFHFMCCRNAMFVGCWRPMYQSVWIGRCDCLSNLSSTTQQHKRFFYCATELSIERFLELEFYLLSEIEYKFRDNLFQPQWTHFEPISRIVAKFWACFDTDLRSKCAQNWLKMSLFRSQIDFKIVSNGIKLKISSNSIQKMRSRVH